MSMKNVRAAAHDALDFKYKHTHNEEKNSIFH